MKSGRTPYGKEAMYHFAVTETTEDLHACQRLRAEVYCRERGFVRADGLTPDGRDEDGYDMLSAHVAAYDLQGSVVGTARIILPDAGLQIEEEFGVQLDTPSIEVSRLAVAKEHRGNHVAVMGLCRMICAEVERLGYNLMYAIMERPLIGQLQWYGFPFRILGEKQLTKYGTLDYPTVCPLDEVVPAMQQADEGREHPQVADFFAAPFDGGVVSRSQLALPELV